MGIMCGICLGLYSMLQNNVVLFIVGCVIFAIDTITSCIQLKEYLKM